MPGYFTFTAGQPLNASDVADYLQKQMVMVFAGTAARGSALGTAVVREGMLAYIGGGTVTFYDGSSWKVLR